MEGKHEVVVVVEGQPAEREFVVETCESAAQAQEIAWAYVIGNRTRPTSYDGWTRVMIPTSRILRVLTRPVTG